MAASLTRLPAGYHFTPEQIHELVFQAAGAATAPLLRDNPDYVFPSEDVKDAVNDILSDFGVDSIRGYA